ncbi:MAG: toxin-antitoxin system protein [Chloroflexi bacterium]|nr:toxin-antitoxin system protein [Chloroflexota bacterium]
METTTVRVGRQTLEVLRRLSEESGEAKQQVLARAIEAYRRQRMLEQHNAAYAALRADPEAWREEQEECRLWEVTLSDGQAAP